MKKTESAVNAFRWEFMVTASEAGRNWKHENNSASLAKGPSG